MASLRGFACLLLVAYHVVGAEPDAGLRITDAMLRDANDAVGYLRMPLFALLAGLFYGRHPPVVSLFGFVRDKGRRLLLPMLVVGTIFAATQALVPGTNASIGDWRTLHLIPVAHYWFLWAIFWNFVLAALLDQLGAFRSRARAGGVLALSCVASMALPGTNWLALDGALYLLPYFMLGLVIGRHGDRSHGPRVTLGLACLASALGLLLLLGMPPLDGGRRVLAILLPAMLCCVAGVLLWPRNALLARIGESSYAVFLYHVFFTAGVRIVAGDGAVLDYPWAVGLAALIAGVAGPMLVEAILLRHRWTAVAGLGQVAARHAR